MRDFITTSRPLQWIKNSFVLAPLIFAERLTDPESVLTSFGAVVLFCLLSSSVYYLNDGFDREIDRLDARKRMRPIASGRITQRVAFVVASIGIAICLLCSMLLSGSLMIVLSLYSVLMIAYSAILRRVAFADVISIALGFVLRVIAGSVVLDVPFSVWLLICTFFIAVLLAIGKRLGELGDMRDAPSVNRPSFMMADKSVLDMSLGVVAASTVVSYTLYTVSDVTASKFDGNGLVLTVPLVLYGVMRYLYLANIGKGIHNPSLLVLTDKGIRYVVSVWLLLVILIIYFIGGDLGSTMIHGAG
tara:strand:- start:1231 stop:2139 length:909 start_codon:yes stop_codon:yes gene_type:complete